MTEAGCNTHGRRKFGKAEDAEPVLAREGIRFLKGVYRLEAEAREQGLSGEALLGWRQSKMKPVMEDFRAWMAYHKPTLLPKNPVRKAIQYDENHWVAPTRFLADPGRRMLSSRARGVNHGCFRVRRSQPDSCQPKSIQHGPDQAHRHLRGRHPS